MTINIFAEHLININTVRVQVTLPTDQGQARARLSPGGTEIVVSHGEESASLRLPVRLIGKQEELQVPASPTTVLNYRFSIRPAITSSLDSAKTANVVPWTASQLAATSAAYCSSCGCNLLAAGKIKAWKDLPSEGWAEMMEFWHCHKPAEPELPSGQTRKGYSSTSRLDLKPGTGYVAPTSFLLMLQDLHNTESSSDATLSCEQCESTVGSVDASNASVRLFKYALAVSMTTTTATKAFTREKWLACSLLTAVDSQGLSKLVVSCDSSANQALLVWIFARDICISSTYAPDAKPRHVVKVMWKLITTVEATAMNEAIDKQAATFGSIEMSHSELSQLTSSLQETSRFLPKDMQHFQDWTVSLMSKFTSEDRG